MSGTVASLEILTVERAAPTPRLIKSRYLRVLGQAGGDAFFFYHSLFGNLHRVDPKCLQVIDYFSEPASCGGALETFSGLEEIHDLIEEFRSLYYLVDEGFDERSLTRRALERRSAALDDGELVSAIQLNVSEGCNLKCTYCFADRVDERATLYNIGVRNDRKLMSLETALHSVGAVADLARRHGKESLVIKFFGREPLLNWRVMEGVIDHCELGGQDFRYYYAVTTNGTLFSPEIVDKLKSVNTEIVVSLDGFAAANLLRVTHSGKETFSSVDRGLSMLHERGVSCAVASVLSEFNFEEVGEDFLSYLKGKSVRQWEIKLAMQSDRAPGRPPAEYARKLFDLYRAGKEAGIAVTGDWYDPFVTLFHTTKRAADETVQRLAPNSCSATDHQISIEPSGGIFGCRALDTGLGSVDDLASMFRSAAYKHLSMRTYYNVPFCHGCKLEGFCQGVCLGHSERKYKDIYRPDDAYCEIYREVFDLLLQDYSAGSLNSEPFTV